MRNWTHKSLYFTISILLLSSCVASLLETVIQGGGGHGEVRAHLLLSTVWTAFADLFYFIVFSSHQKCNVDDVYYIHFLSRVVGKENMGKCPSRSSVYSECWGWLNCSAKERAFELFSGLLSSRCRSASPHNVKCRLWRCHGDLLTVFLLLCSWPSSTQALPYVGLLIAMIFFIYAVIGMQVRVEDFNRYWFKLKCLELIYKKKKKNCTTVFLSK